MLEELAGGVAAASAAEILHAEPIDEHLEYVKEITHLLRTLCSYFTNTPINKVEKHVTINTWLDHDIIIRYEGYLGVYILVAASSTFTVTISGLAPFTWTPAVGTYNRWRFPEGTKLKLLTPSSPTNFPVDVLFTDDLTNN